MSSIRILVADDYTDWRRQIRLLLQVRPEWQVISEAMDGPEAVQKAEELKPDLILLDIGLPTLNGIEAARQIRQVSPTCKIIFLSQENSLDVVEAALSTGAQGYVQKADALSELLSAIEAVLRGRQFVSSGLEDYKPRENTIPQASHRHEVQFYSDDSVLLERLTHFIAAALEAGNPAIVFGTGAHRNSLLKGLKAQGVDVDSAIQRGAYIPLDAYDTLSMFMVNDWPDPIRFFEGFGNLLERASKAAMAERPRVAIFGEGVALLCEEGKRDAAIRLEQLGNDLAKTYEVDILCAYPSSLHIQEDENAFRSICAAHSVVYSQ